MDARSKGCFVCGKGHVARQWRNREKISAAIERFKTRHPKELPTVEYMSSIYQIDETDKEKETTENFEDQVQ